MLWKNTLSLSVLVLSIALAVRMIFSAEASMPVGMQYGQFPYESFSHCDAGSISPAYYCNGIPSGTLTTLLTVPSDRIFVVTGAQRSYCRLLIDGVTFMSGTLGYYNYSDPFTSGTAHKVIPAGSSLQVYAYSSCEYYVEGYYAHP